MSRARRVGSVRGIACSYVAGPAASAEGELPGAYFLATALALVGRPESVPLGVYPTAVWVRFMTSSTVCAELLGMLLHDCPFLEVF